MENAIYAITLLSKPSIPLIQLYFIKSSVPHTPRHRSAPLFILQSKETKDLFTHLFQAVDFDFELPYIQHPSFRHVINPWLQLSPNQNQRYHIINTKTPNFIFIHLTFSQQTRPLTLSEISALVCFPRKKEENYDGTQGREKAR